MAEGGGVRERPSGYTRRITSETLPPATYPPEHCPSCGAERQGRFCHGCGQRFPVGRLTLGGLWRELPARLFNLDRGLLHTFLDLCRRPGRTARDYALGRRSAYTAPLTYFLLAAAVQLLALALVGDALRAQFEEQLLANPAMLEAMGPRLGENPGERMADIYFGLMQQGYTYLFLLFMTLPFALCLRVVAQWLEPAYNLAEIAVFSLYTSAHMVLVTGLLLPITGRIDANLHAILSMVIYFAYAAWAARGFFDGGARRVVLTWVALVGALATFWVALMVAFLVAIFRGGG